MNQNNKNKISENKSKQKLKTIVILDTNFLAIPFDFKTDIVSEFERLLNNYSLFIFDKTIDEINNISDKQKKKFMLLYIEHNIKNNNIKIIKTDTKYIDRAIIEYVAENENKSNIVIATQDIELKKRLNDFKVSIIILRSKNHLEFERRSSFDL